jgi:hypothetical protein
MDYLVFIALLKHVQGAKSSEKQNTANVSVPREEEIQEFLEGLKNDCYNNLLRV